LTASLNETLTNVINRGVICNNTANYTSFQCPDATEGVNPFPYGDTWPNS